LVIALPLVHQVAAVDLSTMKVAHTIDVGMRTQEVLLAPDGQTAYVSCDQDGKVAVISLADWKVKNVIDAGKGADGLAWAASGH
jgi:DNA-binding beta-propeller fold protein YncE